jgi:murein DD-endopeptidase
MIAPWADRYVGIPWRPRGRDITGVDCWGLVVLVCSEIHRVDLPSYADAAGPDDQAAMREVYARDWPLPCFRETDRPEAGTLALFRVAGAATHVGVLVGDGHFLHAWPGVGCVVARLSDPRWRSRLVGVYRVG